MISSFMRRDEARMKRIQPRASPSPKLTPKGMSLTEVGDRTSFFRMV